MKYLKEPWFFGLVAGIMVFVLGVTFPLFLGYHLEWSWINGKFIWVK